MSTDMEKRRKNAPNVASKKRNPSPSFCLRTHRMTKTQSLIPSPTVARSYTPQQLASTSLDALDRDRHCCSSSLSSSAPPPVPPPLHLLGLISGPLKQTVLQIAVEHITRWWRARESSIDPLIECDTRTAKGSQKPVEPWWSRQTSSELSACVWYLPIWLGAESGVCRLGTVGVSG